MHSVFSTQKNLLAWSAVGLLATAGCQSPLAPQPHAYRAWIEQDPDAWRLEEASTQHRLDTLRATADNDAALPTDIEALVRLAWRHHPGLHAARRRVERLQQRAPQVASLDDPTLRVVPIGEQAETAAGRVGLQAGVSQKLPFPGKLAARKAVAQRDAAAADMHLATLRLEVAADMRRAYWGWRYAQRAAEVVTQDRELLEQLQRVAEAKYRAGTAEQQDVLRAQVERASVEKTLLTLEQQRRSSVAMINRLLDRPIDAELPEPGDEDRWTDPAAIDTDLDRLLTMAAHHPRLAALREQAARYRGLRQLANLDRYPDLTVSLHFNEVGSDGDSPVSNGDDQWFVGFGINLPLWQGKRDAAEQEALAGLYETAAMLADAQNQLAFRVRDALARVEAQRQVLALFDQQMLPDAEQAVAAAESSYRTGNAGFLTLIDNWRRLTGLRLTYEQAATQLQKDLADLRQAAAWPDETPDHPEARPKPIPPAERPES